MTKLKKIPTEWTDTKKSQQFNGREERNLS
jgi:hypothetical protein